MTITVETLNHWNSVRKIFKVEIVDDQIDELLLEEKINALLDSARDKKSDETLSLTDLALLNDFFLMFNLQNLDEYAQLTHAIQAEFKKLYTKEWFAIAERELQKNNVSFSSVITTLHYTLQILTIYEINTLSNFQYLCQHPNDMNWTMDRFSKIVSNTVVNENKQHQEVFELMSAFSKIKPYKNTEETIDTVIEYTWEQNHENLNNLLRVSTFKQNFISPYICSSGVLHRQELLEKILSINKNENLCKTAAMTSALVTIDNTHELKLRHNFLNTKLLCEYPNLAENLYQIFAQLNTLNKKSLHTYILNNSLYEKITHQDVLANLNIINFFVLNNQTINTYLNFNTSANEFGANNIHEELDAQRL